MAANVDDLLLGATCAVRTPDDCVVGTAWLLDNKGHLLTAGHLLGTETPTEEVMVTFLDDSTRYRARRIAWQYNFNSGVDFAVLELLGPIPARAPLPISLARHASGTLKLFGYGKTLVHSSPAIGSFVGPYHPQDVTANRLFSLESLQSREEGYSGAAIFSTDAQAVVAIQIEGTVVRADAAHGTTVLAMPLFRIAEFVNTVPIFADAIAARDDDYYLYHVYLSYERDGLVERWLNLFLLDELTGWLQQELAGKPEVFFDHNPMRRVWDSKVVEAIRRSCCLVAISSPTYWESPECLAELESFKERQRLEKAAVMLGIVFHGDPGVFNASGGVEWQDFKKHAQVYEGFRESAEYGPFQRAVKDFAMDLKKLLSNVPQYEGTWPVVAPAIAPVVPPPGGLRIGKPRL